MSQSPLKATKGNGRTGFPTEMGQRSRPQTRASSSDIQSRLGPKSGSDRAGGSGLAGRQGKKPYSRPLDSGPSHADAPGKWKHDKFAGPAHPKGLSRGARHSGAKGETRLRVSNLHPQASQEDIHTTFAAFGTIVSLVIEQSGNLGRSQGQSVLLTYRERASALRAIENFHGQLADGKAVVLSGVF